RIAHGRGELAPVDAALTGARSAGIERGVRVRLVPANLRIGHHFDDVAVVRIRTNAVHRRVEVTPARLLLLMNVVVKQVEPYPGADHTIHAQAVTHVLLQLEIANHVPAGGEERARFDVRIRVVRV